MNGAARPLHVRLVVRQDCPKPISRKSLCHPRQVQYFCHHEHHHKSPVCVYSDVPSRRSCNHRLNHRNIRNLCLLLHYVLHTLCLGPTGNWKKLPLICLTTSLPSLLNAGLTLAMIVFRLDPAAQATSAQTEALATTPEFGVNIHLLRDERSLDSAHSAGFRFVRMDMLWADVERRGRFRFLAYDALLRACEARQMGVLWILDYGHPDHGGTVPRTPEDVAAFGRFAEAAAAHFQGHNVRYEIWNEPNVAAFWSPSPNPVECRTLLRDASSAVRCA